MNKYYVTNDAEGTTVELRASSWRAALAEFNALAESSSHGLDLWSDNGETFTLQRSSEVQ